MLSYFNNAGVSVGAIRLGKDGVWLNTDTNKDAITITTERAMNETTPQYAYLRAKTPSASNANLNDVVTIEWMGRYDHNEISYNFTPYDDAVQLINGAKEEIELAVTNCNILANRVSVIESTLNQLDVDQLASLFSSKIILDGGTIAGWQ